MPKFKPLFKIGDVVEVSKVYVRQMEYITGGTKKWWELKKTTRGVYLQFPFKAIVTGYRFLYDGRIDKDYEYGNTWVQNKSHRAVCVRVGMLNKELYTSEGCCHKLDEEFEVPYYANPTNSSEEVRKWMSEEAPNWPRDAKGRFCRYDPLLPNTVHLNERGFFDKNKTKTTQKKATTLNWCQSSVLEGLSKEEKKALLEKKRKEDFERMANKIDDNA